MDRLSCSSIVAAFAAITVEFGMTDTVNTVSDMVYALARAPPNWRFVRRGWCAAQLAEPRGRESNS